MPPKSRQSAKKHKHKPRPRTSKKTTKRKKRPVTRNKKKSETSEATRKRLRKIKKAVTSGKGITAASAAMLLTMVGLGGHKALRELDNLLVNGEITRKYALWPMYDGEKLIEVLRQLQTGFIDSKTDSTKILKCKSNRQAYNYLANYIKTKDLKNLLFTVEGKKLKDYRQYTKTYSIHSPGIRNTFSSGDVPPTLPPLPPEETLRKAAQTAKEFVQEGFKAGAKKISFST